jgi:hypothetical protein
VSLEHATAPDFTLESTGGGEVTLSETLADGDGRARQPRSLV